MITTQPHQGLLLGAFGPGPRGADGVQIGLKLAYPPELNIEVMLVQVSSLLEPHDAVLEGEDARAVAGWCRGARFLEASPCHGAASLAPLAAGRQGAHRLKSWLPAEGLNRRASLAERHALLAGLTSSPILGRFGWA